MTPPDDYQSARYDHKAHRLVEACLEGLVEEEGSIILDSAAWNALASHLARFLMPGDLVRYAHEHPGVVLDRAMKLLDDADWMARARSEAATARKA